MSEYNEELDPISFWILLLLSGGQQFTFHDLVRIMNRSNESVWEALQILQSRQYAKNTHAKFIIDYAGVEYLTKRGILAGEAEDEPKVKDFKRGFKPPFFFSNWADMLIWLVLPFVLTFAAVLFSRNITDGYNFITIDRSMTQMLIWGMYALLLGLYIWGSYHHILEYERIVVFFGGKVIAQKGPGHILLLPIFHNSKRVDLRERSQVITKEPCLTRDNLLVNTGFYIAWEITDPILMLTKVSKVEEAMSQLSAAVLRATIAEFILDEALERRRALNTLIQTRIQHKAEDWGVQVNTTEIRELEPSQEIIRSIENKFAATLENERVLSRTDAQTESLKRLMQIGSRIDDRTFNIFNTLVNNPRDNFIDNISKEGISNSTKEFLSNHPEFNLLHLELSLPSLVTATEFYDRTEGVINAVDFSYSLITIFNNGTEENILELTSLLTPTNTSLSNAELHNILKKNGIPPLLISSLKYASPVVEDLLGIGKSLEILAGIIKDVMWRGKYEKKVAEIDVESKENSLKRLELENQKLQLELLEKQIDLIEKGKKLKLSQKEKELLLSALVPKIDIISKSDINPLLLSVKKEKKQFTEETVENDKKLSHGN